MTTSKPDYLTKTLSPDTVLLGVKASKYDLWGDTSIQSMASTITPVC